MFGPYTQREREDYSDFSPIQYTTTTTTTIIMIIRIIYRICGYTRKNRTQKIIQIFIHTNHTSNSCLSVTHTTTSMVIYRLAKKSNSLRPWEYFSAHTSNEFDWLIHIWVGVGVML